MAGINPFDSGSAIDAIRNGGYAFKDALCELIDNSIWHGQAKNMQIDISWNTRSTSTERMSLEEVFVTDNGVGMTTDSMSRAVQIGGGSSLKSVKNFGRFGFGLIGGAISQCKIIQIYSKTKDGDWNYIQYDVDQITSGALIPEPVQQSPDDKYTSIIEESGTVVIWKEFDRAESFDDNWDAYNAAGQKHGDLGYLKYELGRIYRKFIGEEILVGEHKEDANRTVTKAVKNNDLRVIILNGKKIMPVDPLYMTKISGFENDPPPSNVYDEVVLPVTVHHVDADRTEKTEDIIQIRFSIINEKWRTHDEKGSNPQEKELYPRYIHWNKGISVLRMGREVSFGRLQGVGPREETIDRYWGCEIDFPATLDSLFTIKNVKIGIKPVKQLEERLDQILNPTIQAAIRVIKLLLHQSKADAAQTANAGPHTAAEDRFKSKGVGEDVVVAEVLPPDEIDKRAEEMAKKYGEFDASISREKFKEIGIIFQDDVNMHENGPFLEVKNNLGNNIIIYNLKHPFWIHLQSIYSRIDEIATEVLANDPEEIGDKLRKEINNTRYLIDLLLGSFGAGKGSIDPDAKQVTSSTLNTMVSRWTDSLFVVSNDKNFEKRVK